MAVGVMVVSFVVMLLLDGTCRFCNRPIRNHRSAGHRRDAAIDHTAAVLCRRGLFVLLAIPLFILAGALMETGGISLRWSNWPAFWSVMSAVG